MNCLPHLIVGQGLAGTALAWRLLDRGVPFLTVDRHETVTASGIAAGLVTPITGMRLNLSWRFATLYPQALTFYRGLEKRLGQRLFRPVPVVRVLRDTEASDLWRRRLDQPEIQRHVRHCPPQPPLNGNVFSLPHGAFQQRHSGWLDTAAYLSASRAYFRERGLWQAGEVSPEDLQVEDPAASARQGCSGPVLWRGRRYATVIFCNGWEAAKMRWFDWVPFQSARGTVLTLRADTRGERRVVSRGTWLLPGEDGSLRAGSTYEWDFSDPHVASPAAIAGLENNLHRILRVPFQVTASQTAVRPIIKGREALLGRHPGHPQIAFLNGLGSKGVLRAPWLANHLAAHLVDGAPLDGALDLAGNL